MRASRGEEFDIRQIWYDRKSGCKHFLRIIAKPYDGSVILSLEKDLIQTIRQAVLGFEAGIPIQTLLRNLVLAACDLTGARYGALGILKRDRTGIEEFVPTGLSEETIQRIGRFPSGRGLLGAVIRSKTPIRVGRIDQDPRFSGFPPHHPKMTSFLGVPLRIQDDVFGNFYLTDKCGAAEFSEQDEKLIELLGTYASLAIGYARQLEGIESEKRKSLSHFQELERLREEFAAIVAHDLRNPIQAITSQIEILLREPPGCENKIGVPVPILQQIHRTGLRLNQMAMDLLDAARIEVSRVSLELKTFDPADLISTFIEDIRPTAAEHPIELEHKAPTPKIAVDPLRFGQIMTNLLENATKFSGVGAPIHVCVGTSGKGCLISVKDQGTGIALEDQERLFDRFYQAKRARQKRTGLGLGLYITKGLVEAHRGKIWVESKVGQGSTFHIWFPPSP